jgi:hypothetical protein
MRIKTQIKRNQKEQDAMLLKDDLKPQAIALRRADPKRNTDERIAGKLYCSPSAVRLWIKEHREETGEDLRRSALLKPVRAKKTKHVDIAKQLGTAETMPASEGPIGSKANDLVASIKDILLENWSVSYLESMNVPLNLAAELLQSQIQMQIDDMWKTGTEFKIVAVTLSYLVSLFRDYPEIPADTAKSIAVRTIMSFQLNDEIELAEIETQLRFQPWRNKELSKAYREHVKNFARRM